MCNHYSALYVISNSIAIFVIVRTTYYRKEAAIILFYFSKIVVLLAKPKNVNALH